LSTNTAPQAAPETTPKTKSWFARHKFLTGLLVVVVFIAVATQLGGEDTAGTNAGGDQPSVSEDSAATAGIGDSVADGKFEFTVTKVETGVETIGASFLREKAQGQYVLVHVNVENVGDEAQYLSATDQYLYDADGREYSADDTAWTAMENNPLMEQINPGNSVKGIVVFDIPKNVEPTQIELHDSMFSGGVTVRLAK